MAAGPGQSGSPSAPPISASAARQIASGFQVPVAEVVLEAYHVSAWNGAADDLLVWLEHRHRWNAHPALGYLLSLRHALRLHSGDGPSG